MSISEIKWPAVAIAALLLFCMGAGLAWWIEGMRWAADVATKEASHAADMTMIANTAQQQTANVLTQQQVAQAAQAAVDADYQEKLKNAQTTIDTLRAGVDAGSISLHIAATCDDTGSRNAVSGNSGAASRADATGPRLTDAAQRDYFTLRERISAANEQIAGLQSYVTNVCLIKGDTKK